MKPTNFPDVNAAAPATAQGMMYWFKVMLWQPVLMASLIAFCGVLLSWLQTGWLPLRVAGAALWSAIPLVLTILYVRDGLPKTFFGLLLLIWTAPLYVIARKIPSKQWRELSAFLLGLNIIECLALVPEGIVTAMGWEAGYKGVAAGAGLWMLISGGLGLKALPPSRPLARSLLALLFSLILQITVVIASFLLGWLPPETLKALLYG
ncbi:MAG: hypothetical protein AAB036_05680 [Elusimicrobiota bacterium]